MGSLLKEGRQLQALLSRVVVLRGFFVARPYMPCSKEIG